MADNVRSHRSRDALARGEFDSAVPDASGDPLAELARLIGQSDANGEGGRQDRYDERYQTDRYEANGYDAPAATDGAADAGLDWAADEDYAEESGHGRGRNAAPPPPAGSYQAVSSPAQGYEDEPPAGPRFFSGPAAAFNGFREDEGDGANADYAPRSEPPPAPVPDRRALPFGVAPREQPYPARADEHDGGQDYAPDDYDDEDETPRRPSGLVLVMAVLGLAVIGTAGAFGYHAMFGGSLLPQLPPIIKANGGPNKIVPTNAPAANPGQPGAAGAPPAERLAPPPEQPVDLNKTAPRVVSTIPIGPGADPAAPSAPVPPAPAPALPAPAAVAPVAPPPPAQTSAEPKRVHTVQIHAEQPTGNAAPAAPPSHRQVSAPPPPRGNAPLSIVPGGGDAAAEPAPPRSPAAAPPARAPLTVASAGSATEAQASGGGGYAVQVSSQRSEAEAKASFHALRAKFPKELGGREPIVRRADLGAKGIYYRALVGPFASMEEAASLCSSLKAAGGNCLIQRN